LRLPNPHFESPGIQTVTSCKIQLFQSFSCFWAVPG
jgi:hypothetical protein